MKDTKLINKIKEIKEIKEKVFFNEKGNVYQFLKKTDQYFINFSEVYFSKIKYNQIKGWKKHTLMSMNIVVPFGNVEFVFYDETNQIFKSFIIGENNYKRLFVPKGIWFAFKGISKDISLIANLSNILHNDSESLNQPIENIYYDWNLK